MTRLVVRWDPNSCRRSVSCGAGSRRPSEPLTKAPRELLAGLVPLDRLPNAPRSGLGCRPGPRRQETLVAQRLGGREAGRAALQTPVPRGATTERHGAGWTGRVNLGVRLIRRVECLPRTRRGSGAALSRAERRGRGRAVRRGGLGLGTAPRVPGVATSGLRREWLSIWRSRVGQRAQQVPRPRGPWATRGGLQRAGRERAASERRGSLGRQVTWKCFPSGRPQRLDFVMHSAHPMNVLPGRRRVRQEFARKLRTPVPSCPAWGRFVWGRRRG